MLIDSNWNWAPGHEGRYAVSRDGRVMSYARKTPRLLRPQTIRGGYKKTALDGATWLLHRLVWAAFGSEPLSETPHKVHVAHLDGDPTNNHIANLKQCSAKENASHRIGHGTQVRGEDSPMAVLTREKVMGIRRAAIDGTPRAELAEKYAVSAATIADIIRRRTWRHLDWLPGEPKPKKKTRLTAEKVLAIREQLWSTSRPQKDIAAEFGLSQGGVSAIKRRASWAHLPLVEGEEGEVTPRQKGGNTAAARANSPLTEDDVRAIKAALRAGETTQAAIARQHGVTVKTISNIKVGRTWADAT